MKVEPPLSRSFSAAIDDACQRITSLCKRTGYIRRL
jgi:hypothetical protein